MGGLKRIQVSQACSFLPNSVVRMNETPQPLISINIPGGACHTFYSLDDIDAWLLKERNAFQWLLTGGSQAGGGVALLSGNYQRHFDAALQLVAQWKNAPTNKQLAQQAQNTFNAFYAPPQNVCSDHSAALFANAISSKYGTASAAAAFGTLLGVDCGLNLLTLKGIIAAVVNREGNDPNSPKIVSEAIDRLNASTSEERAKRDEERAKRDAEWNAFTQKAESQLELFEKTFNEQVAKVTKDTAQMMDALQTSTVESISNIKNTEATYREQMKLRAAVKYWEDKGTKHKTDLEKSRRNLIGFALVGSVVLVVGLFYLTISAADIVLKSSLDATNTAIYLKFAAIGAVITTIAFWIGRILLRIYLSDRHLLSDAEERIAMVMTYLALSNEGKIEPSDRALILTPLFGTVN